MRPPQRLVEVSFSFSRKEFTFQLPAQFKVASVGKSDWIALDFESEIVFPVDVALSETHMSRVGQK